MLRFGSLMMVVTVLTTSIAFAQDWSSLPYTPISTYEDVTSSGGSAYSGGFPVKMYGVVINNTEDWLDPTPAYDPGVHLWEMGGESELIVQAVEPSDFGGVFCWMGQNYGNHIAKQDPFFSYTDAEWTAELGRLNLYGGDGVTDPIRAGDLVEIRARIGLNYGGKMNVNEAHSNTPANDFEIVVLQRDYGMPTPKELTLSDFKNADNTFIFDATRQIGGEQYQGSLVELQDVWVSSMVNWTTDTDITVTDGVRTFNIYLGLNPAFDGTELFAPGEHFNVMGIVDQASANGMDGYQLLALNAYDILGDFDDDGDIDADDIDLLMANLGDTSLTYDLNGDGVADQDDVDQWVLNIVPIGENIGTVYGDFNLDGEVNAGDLALLATNYGLAGDWGWATGDSNGDGNVDAGDLALLASNYGTVVHTVPEPATLALLAMGAMAMARRR
jgi:hypothetical protein